MAEIVDLTADSPPRAAAEDDAVVARLEAFTGASADSCRAALAAHGNDAEAAAALFAAMPDAPASAADLGAIRRLRDAERAAAPAAPASDADLAAIRRLRDAERAAVPSIKEMKAAISAAGLAVADLVEKSDVVERYQQALAQPAAEASDGDLAAIRRLRDEERGQEPDLAQQLAAARRRRAAHHSARPPVSVTGELKVLTYNVWFEHEETFAKRMAVIARECRNADVVGFQEVTDDSFPYLEAALKRHGFPRLLKQDTPAPYYCCVAAKKSLREVRTTPFRRSMMGRGVLLAVASWGDVDVHVGVVHLESFVGKDQDATVRVERKRQLTAAGAELEKLAGNGLAVLLGDCNWDDTDGAAPLAGWRDAWEEAGYPRAAQYTYDGRANGMLSHRYQNRYDRIFVSGKLAGVSAFELVGTARLPDLTITDRHKRVLPCYPSDHFGALVTLAPAGTKPAANTLTDEQRARAERNKQAALAKKKPADFFAPRKPAKRAKTAVKYRGAAVPDGWELDGDLLVGRFGGDPRAPPWPENAARVAGFDFDDTLSPLDWGTPDAWSHLYEHAPTVVRKLAADGAAIAVISNECLDRYKRLDYLEKKMRDKCSKIGAWAEDVGVPVLALIALSKKDETKYHKSCGDGMWRRACADLGVSGGFYVGDSKDDENLARVAGVPFHHVKAFFERVHAP